jgi:hypothetical protein
VYFCETLKISKEAAISFFFFTLSSHDTQSPAIQISMSKVAKLRDSAKYTLSEFLFVNKKMVRERLHGVQKTHAIFIMSFPIPAAKRAKNLDPLIVSASRYLVSRKLVLMHF